MQFPFSHTAVELQSELFIHAIWRRRRREEIYNKKTVYLLSKYATVPNIILVSNNAGFASAWLEVTHAVHWMYTPMHACRVCRQDRILLSVGSAVTFLITIKYSTKITAMQWRVFDTREPVDIFVDPVDWRRRETKITQWSAMDDYTTDNNTEDSVWGWLHLGIQQNKQGSLPGVYTHT